MFNKIFFGLLAALALFGFILPFLISSNSNELTILGTLVILTLAYGAGKTLSKYLNKGNK
jgi:hypothetical protein